MVSYGTNAEDQGTEIIELMGLPGNDGFGNLIAMFDRLESSEALLVVDNRKLHWVLKILRDLRAEDLDESMSHAFSKPANNFLYIKKQ